MTPRARHKTIAGLISHQLNRILQTGRFRTGHVAMPTTSLPLNGHKEPKKPLHDWPFLGLQRKCQLSEGGSINSEQIQYKGGGGGGFQAVFCKNGDDP